MGLSERLGGEWWWTLNMGILGDVGALGSLLGHMGWSYGKDSS
jgi:hypothetical protein